MIDLEEPDFLDVPFGRGAFRVYGKDNNYPYYRWYLNLPRDGKTPNVNSWHFSVHHGVNEGVAGPMTCKELVRPVLTDAALRREVDPAIIAAFATLESGWDPGAQGIGHSSDLGYFQCNVEDTEVTWTEAFDPILAADIACKRYAAARQRYKGKGAELRLACSIAQHNSPVWADQWFAAGEAPNETIANYVASVVRYIPAW
jgi:hypothetical protein